MYQSAKTRPEEQKHFVMFLHHVATAEDKNSKKDVGVGQIPRLWLLHSGSWFSLNLKFSLFTQSPAPVLGN